MSTPATPATTSQAADPNQLTPEQIAQNIANQSAPAAQVEPLERDFSVVLETGQTYKGKTKDEVIAQLVKAQENASRRITELSQQAPTQQQVQQTQNAQPTFDQSKYYQLLATDPIAANDYYLDFSPKAKALNTQLEQLEAMRQDIAGRTEFVTFQNAAPDFPFEDQTAVDKFDAEWKKLGLPWTAQNLLLAHNHFVRTGVYQPKAQGQQQTIQGVTPPPPPPMNSGGPTNVQTQKDPNTMTQEELKAYIESLNGQR